MHVGVSLGLQRIGAHAYADFQAEEIDFYLNRAILALVRDRIAKGLGPEEEKDIYTLVTSASVNLSLLAGYTHLYTGDLPASFLAPIKGKVLGTAATAWGSGTVTMESKITNTADALEHVPSITDSPIFRDYPLFIFGAKVGVVADLKVTTLSSVLLYYVTTPTTVVLPTAPVNCNLPAHVHQEVVDIAVDLMTVDLQHGQEQ